MQRLVVGGSLFMNEKVEDAEFNPGLGCITRNKKHRAEIAKSRGLEEIGNENPDKIEKALTKEREERLEKRHDGIHDWWQKEKRVSI